MSTYLSTWGDSLNTWYQQTTLNTQQVKGFYRGGYLYLGGHTLNSNQTPLIGQMVDFKFWDTRALSQNEIKAEVDNKG